MFECKRNLGRVLARDSPNWRIRRCGGVSTPFLHPYRIPFPLYHFDTKHRHKYLRERTFGKCFGQGIEKNKNLNYHYLMEVQGGAQGD